jgi:hypothetical protein
VLFQRRFISVGIFLAVAAMTGCSGGSTAGPAPSVTATPGSSNTTLVAIPAAGGTVALTAVAGITPGFAIGSGAPAGLTASTTASVSAPSGAPTLSVARKTQSATSPIAPFLYVTATFSANVPAGVVLSELLQLASSLPANADYYCALTDLTAASQTATFGPAVPVNGIVTISNGAAVNTPAFTAGHTYLFEFYELPIPTATPTPTPSPASTATGLASPSPTPAATGSSSPVPSPSPTQTSAGTATPPPVFTFTGPSATSASVTPPTVPAAIVVPATGTYGTHAAHVSIQLGAAGSSAAYTVTATLGSVGDITSNNFPFYTGSAATPLFYVELEPSVPVTFSQTPAVTVTVNSFGSSNSCSLFIYGNTGGSTYQWIQVGIPVNVSGNTVTIPAAAGIGSQVNFLPTQAQLGFVGC